jgi:hypothetical protein
MTRAPEPLEALARPQRRALRTLLIKATAAAGWTPDGGALDPLVRAAPLGALPSAAALHRLSGTVLRGLDGAAGVPVAVRQQLEARRLRSSFHHLVVVGALSHAGQAFDAAGLSWVAMKGPIAAGLLYPDVGDRTYGDLDVLVDHRDYPRAIEILEDQGYAHDIHNWALAERVLAGEVGLTSPTVHVDLHWHLHYAEEDRRPFAFPVQEMLGRARRVVVSGVTAPTLDVVDTLITLAFHAARSDGHRLLWMKDLERSLSVEDPDLDELVRRCKAYRCGPPVGLMLGRTRDLLGADVPAEVVEAIVPATLRGADRLTRSLVDPVQFDERDNVTRWLTRSVRSSASSSIADVPARAARHLRRTLFPPLANESDDPVEKARYLAAVAGSGRR